MNHKNQQVKTFLNTKAIIISVMASALLAAGEARSGMSHRGGCEGEPQQLKATPRVPANWEARGTLFEACSCNVPCPCNFGQGPSNGSCNTIYAYRLKRAQYHGVVLDGLVFGGGEGPSGAMGFLDARATATQRPELEKLALAVFNKGGASGGPRKFLPVTLTVSDSPTQFQINFAESGGFAADVLIGADRKNPIIVENNTTWPVHRFIKGKTTRFDYHDSLGNTLKYEGVNANIGEFDLHQ